MFRQALKKQLLHDHKINKLRFISATKRYPKLDQTEPKRPSTGSGRAGLGLPCFLPTPFGLRANIILNTNGFILNLCRINSFARDGLCSLSLHSKEEKNEWTRFFPGCYPMTR